MGAAYSQDLRDRVLAAADRGMPTKQVAAVFAVSPAWVRRVKQRRRESGELSPRPLGGRRRWKIDRERLATALKKLGFTYKKRRSMRPSRTDPTSRGDAAYGVGSGPASTPAG